MTKPRKARQGLAYAPIVSSDREGRGAAGSGKHLRSYALVLGIAIAVGSWPMVGHAEVTWVGGNGQWTDAANWSSNPSLPGSGDDVTIDRPGGDFLIILDAGSQQIGSLACAERLVIAGAATLSIAKSSQISNSLIFATGEIHGSGDLAIQGSMDWSGGTVGGSGAVTVVSGGTLNLKSFTGAMDRELARNLNNAGTILWQDVGMLHTVGSPVINNLAGGVFEVQNNTYLMSQDHAVFNNAGLFRRSETEGEMGIFPAFNNTGTAEVQAGTLSLYGGGSSSGQFSLAAEAKLNFAGGVFTVTNPAGLPRAGLMLTEGKLVIAGDHAVSDLVWRGGTLAGDGTTTISSGGTMDLSGFTGVERRLERPVVNDGKIAWSDSGALTLADGVVLKNGSTGVIEVAGNPLVGGVGGMVNNEGTFRRSSGSGTMSVLAGVNNTGVWEVASGSVNLTGPVAQVSSGQLNGGTWIVRNGATLAMPNAGAITINRANVVLNGKGSRFANLETLAENRGSLAIGNGKVFATAGAVVNEGSVKVETGGVLEVNGPLSGAGSAEVGGRLTAKGLRQGTLAIGEGGVVTIASGSQVNVVQGMSIAGTGSPLGTLDLNDGSLVVHGGNEAEIAGWVGAGRNGRTGLWQGQGITSSAAAGNRFKGLAVVQNNRGNGSPIRTEIQGEPVGVGDVLVMYSWNGDANLDGVIDAGDYFLIDSGFITQKGGYRNGDFNYDGAVDAGDYFLIDSAFIGQRAELSSRSSAVVVPEPGAWIGALGMAMLAWRRRGRR